MKIALLGAGSYVFGPSVLTQLYQEEALPDVHLALMDPDLETIELMAAAGRRLAQERGLTTTITTHAERPDALAGADFVVCSASPQMQRRTALDWSMIDQYAPGHLKTEFGGVAGISYSLRQIALIEAITDDMRRLCPDAWLLDVANPLPRVAQAAQESGIKTAGFCSASLCAYEMLWKIFHGEPLRYPFAEAQAAWEIVTAGLNHFCWLVEFRERETGKDLLPALRERSRTGSAGHNPAAWRKLQETGFLLVPVDEHTRDFLPPADLDVSSGPDPWHGSPLQRQQRHEELREISAGTRPWNALQGGEAWEKPLRFVSAVSGGAPAQFHALNLRNEARQISNLPGQAFVETPCHVSAGRVTPQRLTLPETVLPLCERTVQVTDTIVRAARKRSRPLVHEAVRLDPTVLDKSAGICAIDACLAAHADILPAYS